MFCGSDVVNVTILALDTKRTVQVDLNETLEEICARERISTQESWFSFGGRPVRLFVPIREYGMCDGSTLIQNLRMRGGSSTPRPQGPYAYRLYTHVLDCERAVLTENFRLQADGLTETQDSADLLSAVTKLLNSFRGDPAGDKVWLADLLENFFQIIYWTRRCRTKADYATCVMLSYKLITGKSVTVSLWKLFKGDNLQDDTFTKLTRDARDLFSSASLLINNPLLKKLRQVYTYLLVQGFLSHFGQEMPVEEFLKLDAKTKIDYKSKTSMAMLIIDVAIAICERVDAYRLTGDWHALLHEEVAYTQWSKDAERLISLAPFTSNLVAHGTTYFAFISDLNDTIEKGEAICKYSAKASGMESTVMRKRLCSLQMLKNVEVTRRASQKERKAPFGVLIHGGSSVGKSSFTKMLYYFYGKVHNLETDDHYRYVRNPTDEYWSNFDSSKWCIQMDDIAFLLPAKSAEVDATLKEMLNVVNNVPYVPPQAALEDKGKTPVMAKLVLATTNAPDLNAQDYFHCPLAVRRRLPYVINIEPKEQYLAANGKFIDPSKLPPITDNFPDYWIIRVQKLVPVEHNGRDSATLETVRLFDNVNEFLKHFAEASVAHEVTQVASDACDIKMRDVKVCRLCYQVGEECACLQASFIGRVFLVYLAQCCVDLCSRLFLMLVCTQLYYWAARFYVVRAFTAKMSSFLNAGVEFTVHSINNRRRQYKLQIAVKHLVQVGLVLTSLFLSVKVGRAVWKATEPKPRVVPLEDPQTDEDDAPDEEGSVKSCSTCGWNWTRDSAAVQGNVLGTTEQQLKKETSQNVWYNPMVELSRFDVPEPSQSLCRLDAAGIRDFFAANCVSLEFHALDVPHAMRLGGIFLKGQYLCFNKHALKRGNRFKLRICDSQAVSGVSSNVEIFFALSEVRTIPECDIAVLKCVNVPPRKDITKFWNDVHIPFTKMVSVARRPSGCVEYRELFNVQLQVQFPVESLDVSMDVYLGMGYEETRDGDCGAIGVAMTPMGPVIMGIHTLGHQRTAGFPHVTRTQLLAVMEDDVAQISAGAAPLLSLNGVALEPIHHKSVLRYIPEGTARVYGSLPGARPKPRSRVCATPLQQEMLEHFGGEVEHGAPVMTGWEPVYKNIVEMVKPDTNIDQTLLDHCVEAYTRDVLDGLQQEHGDSWKGELVYLSDEAAVNGLPGVKFIDGINRGTSMGHPWHGPKKRHLEPYVTEDYPEGVQFSEEIRTRVAEIKSLYAEGKRAYPVFTAHLKDEAVPQAKIDAKKTRVFTGAPVDWSIVVRSRTLAFIRLLQKNKLIFEAAPGTVAQSIEWTQFYDYLTAHGKDQIIAGDYSKFDKHMIPAFVIAAYKVIANVYRAAGFSEEELRDLACIALDTAFPLTNVNGDIIEFNGTNPSGHPCTVIVNSIVNSLYMRYAFCELNPEERTCWQFKKVVNLLTYGDDNGAGVSKRTPWFNHTAVQKTLATIGVGYTMADKDAVSRPYITIEECSFLKRSWRFEEELGMYTCPLEEASIKKSLTVWVPSKTVDQHKQMVDVISSANSEYFFYGRETFEKHHAFFKSILEREPYSFYVTESTLPGWSDLIARFRRASESILSSQ